jgi:hypothetical protein
MQFHDGDKEFERVKDYGDEDNLRPVMMK